MREIYSLFSLCFFRLKLPEGNPLRRNLLEILANWRINLQVNQMNQNVVDDEDRELIMNLSPAYLRWREEAVQEGQQEGQRLILESMLQGRFGMMDEQELSCLITRILQLPGTDRTQLLLNLSNLSREELLARFGM